MMICVDCARPSARGRSAEPLLDGQRHGRFVVVRDMEGRAHAVAAGSVAAVCETDEGASVIMLPGGKLVHVPWPLAQVLLWLDGRGP